MLTRRAEISGAKLRVLDLIFAEKKGKEKRKKRSSHGGWGTASLRENYCSASLAACCASSSGRYYSDFQPRISYIKRKFEKWTRRGKMDTPAVKGEAIKPLSSIFGSSRPDAKRRVSREPRGPCDPSLPYDHASSVASSASKKPNSRWKRNNLRRST